MNSGSTRKIEQLVSMDNIKSQIEALLRAMDVVKDSEDVTSLRVGKTGLLGAALNNGLIPIQLELRSKEVLT